MIRDVLTETTRRLEQNDIHSCQDVRSQSEPVVAFSEEACKADNELGKYLYKNIYRNKNVMRMTVKGKRIIRQLFEAIRDEPNVLDEPYRSRAEAGDYQAICDYIAGMTDRFAMDLYNVLFDPYERAGFNRGLMF
jgi:dGTPase